MSSTDKIAAEIARQAHEELDRTIEIPDGLDNAEAQQRPQPGDEVLRRAHRDRRGLAQHGPRHLCRRHVGKAAGRQPGQEPGCVTHVATGSTSRQALYSDELDQVAINLDRLQMSDLRSVNGQKPDTTEQSESA